MSMWQRWRELREGLGDNISDRFKFDADNDYADDHDQNQSELFKVVLSKYPEETMNFLSGIAQRGDEEVASLLQKLNKDKGQIAAHEPQHPDEKDEVVPSKADVGYSSYGDE